jgi:hypothetical protein
MGSSSEGSIGSAISSAVEVGIDRLTRVGTGAKGQRPPLQKLRAGVSALPGLHRRCSARA